MTYRCKCEQCGNICDDSEILIAQNPFDPTDMLNGCPSCKSVDSLVNACDEPGCLKSATTGWPSDKGYRYTCYEHSEWSKK